VIHLPKLSGFLIRSAENWPIKVLSIALALILFVFHRMSTMEDRFFSVPLDLELSQNLLPASSYTRMIRVTLRGDANSIYPILEDDIETYIDLKKFTRPGSYRAAVQVRKKGTALGVEPLQISCDPMEISLELDQRISKYVPLALSLQGNLAPGYELVSYTLSPTQVVVDGPLTLLGELSELNTDFIDLDGRSEDFSVSVGILNRDPLLTIRGNGMTEFRGYIRKPVPVRNIGGISIYPANLDPGFTAEIQPETGTVRVEGAQTLLDTFTPPPSFMSLDCSGIDEEGDYTLPVTVAGTPGLEILRMEPENAVVSVRLRNPPNGTP
jgi:YbbR domain-containing protein